MSMVSATTVVILICTLLSLTDPIPKITAEPRKWSLPLDLTKHVEDSESLPLDLTKHVEDSESLPLDLAKHVKDSVVDQIASTTELLQQFERFMVDFGRSYSSLAEKMMRFEIFKENLQRIKELMASERGSAKYGVGPFADMSADEFSRKYFRRGGSGPRPREHSVQRRTPGRFGAVNTKDPSERRSRKRITPKNIDPFKTDPTPIKFSNPADKPPSGSNPANPAVASSSTNPKPASFAVASSSTGQKPATSAVASSSTGQKPATSAVAPLSTGQKPVAPVYVQNRVTGQVLPIIRHPVTGRPVIAVPHPLGGPGPHPGAARPVIGVKPLTIKPPERCLSRTGSCKIKSPSFKYDKNAPPGGETPKVTPKTQNVPRDVHWIEGEFYPPPENQNVINEECGTCWAYASAAVMEILVSKKLRQIVRFSKQQLIDCVIENYGCDGGDLKFALTYIMDEGLALEKDYPFTGKNGECLNVTDKYIVTIREIQLMNTTHLIRSGLKNFSPLATYFYAPTGLELYEGGVLEPPPEECQDIERLHAAVIVGYNGDELLMRNSWGPDWGENGNFWIKAGLCGLGNETYAISEWMNLAV